MYTIYQITNLINGKFYIGVHKTNNPMDSYMGSGLAIKRAIKKYGKQSFVKKVLHIFQDDESEVAYSKEVDLIKLYLNDKQCYNLKDGGVGGFSIINNNRHLYPNPMQIEEYKLKNKISRKKNLTPETQIRLKLINQSNIRKAIQSNIGRKRPRQSIFKSEYNVNFWRDNKEMLRDSLSSTYLLVDPCGNEFKTNRLGDFCKLNGLGQVMMNRSAQESGRVISKGRNKGWKCTKI